MPWKLYDRLIEGIPEGVLVRDYCLGLHWSYVEAESGMGVSYTVRGGATRPISRKNHVGEPLKEMAALSKSWNFEEASLGVAALNAWYSQPGLVDKLGAIYEVPASKHEPHTPYLERSRDAFVIMRPKIEAMSNPKVVVVGHFPHLEWFDANSELTILERNCSDRLDTPDSACEYILPDADIAIITGTTLTNKTMPRLLELSKNAYVCLAGPSVIMCQAMLDSGADMAAGRVVTDPEKARAAVKSGSILSFSASLLMATIERKS